MLPKPLYEALPLVYFGLGMLAMAALESPAKFIPALLLVVAGGMVFSMRHSARHLRKPQRLAGRHRL